MSLSVLNELLHRRNEKRGYFPRIKDDIGQEEKQHFLMQRSTI